MQPKSAKQIALETYCERVMQKVEMRLTGTLEPNAGAQMPVSVIRLLTSNADWIAQEQVKAFDHGASSDECAKWIASELLKFGKRPIN